VASAADPAEAVRPEDLPVPPGAIVWTEGGHGGHWRDESGREGRWAPATVPGEPVDAYGCGDCFVAGVTVGLGRDLGLQAALELGARCGATCLTGRGGLGPQLRERI
jgi:ribokinase